MEERYFVFDNQTCKFNIYHDQHANKFTISCNDSAAFSKFYADFSKIHPDIVTSSIDKKENLISLYDYKYYSNAINGLLIKLENPMALGYQPFAPVITPPHTQQLQPHSTAFPLYDQNIMNQSGLGFFQPNPTVTQNPQLTPFMPYQQNLNNPQNFNPH